MQQKKTSDIYKKLKLVGSPFDIFKKTAFIKDMFNSELEVAKFIGAKIKTVSGIRGIIKKSNKNPPGSFRATFEDKVKKSDIVFLRSWYPVSPKKYYNPITSLLLRDKSSWKGMKTVGHLRVERGIKVPRRRDSEYTPIIRNTDYVSAPVKISAALSSALPFSSKPKSDINQPKKDKKRKSDSLYDHPLLDRTVIREPKEKKVSELLNQLDAIKREKFQKIKQRRLEENKQYLKKKKKDEEAQILIKKKQKKEFFKKNGKSLNRRGNR